MWGCRRTDARAGAVHIAHSVVGAWRGGPASALDVAAPVPEPCTPHKSENKRSSSSSSSSIVVVIIAISSSSDDDDEDNNNNSSINIIIINNNMGVNASSNNASGCTKWGLLLHRGTSSRC